MKTHTAALLALLIMAGGAFAESHDFFATMSYPEGGKLREGVELYEVREEGGAPQEYGRRVVRWWPRKGVDVIEVREGMPLREWTLVPDMFDPDKAPEPELDWQIFEHDKLDMPINVAENYVRHIEGYLHPPADGEYTFKIAADDYGSFFLSTDESRDNVKMICYSFAYTHRHQFTRRPGQISEPIPLKKGRKYYYEAIQREGHAHDNLMIVWESATLDMEVPAGEAVSTLDGRVGVVIEKRASLDGIELPPTTVRPPAQPRRFKAHLIGFDGMGNDLGDPNKEEDLREPGVILRMPDGRRQLFGRGSFRREDREYIYRLYQKEMARIKATLDKTEYTVPPNILREFPGGTPAGEPGSWLKQSEHFVIPSGSQGNREWLGLDDPEKAERHRALVFSSYENMYAIYEYCGHLMPFWDRIEKYKYVGRVGGTILDGFKRVSSGPGGGYGAQGLIPGVVPGGGFAHEYGHGFVNQWNGHFCGEIIAQHAMFVVAGTANPGGFNNSLRTWRHNLWGSYDTTMFFRALGFDPNWGTLVVAAIPQGRDEINFYQTLARVGQQRGLFKDGIRGVGDTVGDYAARIPEFDWPIQQAARNHWFAAHRNALEPVDFGKGIYRIPWDEAPEPFGANIIRLVPEAGSTVIEVDFQGYHDPETYSDWRACIVAVGEDEKARYSDLWNKGVMRMERRPGDLRYWLTVAATPTALLTGDRRVRRAYQGMYAVRYPWQVTLKGAAPGAQQLTRSDQDDVYGTYGHLWISGFVPVVPDTEGARRFLDKATAFIERADKTLPTATFTERLEYHNNTRFTRDAISDPRGAPHPNGGGWVSATAEAAPTAYIGPGARVLGNAKVLENAIIEDYAVITGDAVISGHARVGGQAVIGSQTRLGGYQRAWMSLSVAGEEDAPDLTGGSSEEGLWANYAMDQSESSMLEDYYRRENSPGAAFGPVFNGYLYGQPEFVVDGTHRGFVFDGKTQYAELNRRITDLGAITIDMTVKWQGRGEQVLLDCGTGADNRFTLVTGDTLAFTAVVDGRKIAGVTSAEPLKKDTWTRIRLEIDGKKIALWINDKPMGEAASAFRPAQVFKPGQAQRNFIAAAMDGSGKFQGLFANVVIYDRVYGQAFDQLPTPQRDPPRRPVKGFVLDAMRGAGRSQYTINSQREAITQKAMNYWHGIGAGALVRLTEMKLSVPEYVDAVAKADTFWQWKRDTETDAGKAFDALDTTKAQMSMVDEIAAKVRAMETRIRELGTPQQEGESGKTAVPPGEPSARAIELQEEIKALEPKLAELRALEQEVRAAVEAMPESKAAKDEMARLEEEIKEFGSAPAEKLKEALADDEILKNVQTAIGHIRYARDDRRVLRAFGEMRGGLAGGRAYIVEEELKARDAEYRKWSEKKNRLEQLNHEQLGRLNDYALYHTDYPKLVLTTRWSRGEVGDLSRRLDDLRRQLENERGGGEIRPGSDTERDALVQELGALQQAQRDVRGALNEERRAYIQQVAAEAGVNEKETANEALLEKASRAVASRYPIEYNVICSFIRQNFHGFYNARISSYIGQHAVKIAGGAGVPDNPDDVVAMEEFYADPGTWNTRVDQWDGRTRWEVDGSLKDLPLTEKWLRRVGQVK